MRHLLITKRGVVETEISMHNYCIARSVNTVLSLMGYIKVKFTLCD